MAHDATRPQRLWLIGTPGRDRRRLRVQVRTQSKSIECSFNVVSIVLPQCRFNVVYSADRPGRSHFMMNDNSIVVVDGREFFLYSSCCYIIIYYDE